MKDNNYAEISEKIYKFLPYSNYTYTDYSLMLKIHEELKSVKDLLLKLNFGEGFSIQILKTITLISNYFFPKLSIFEQESLSLQFIILFTIENKEKEIINERIKILKKIIFNSIHVNSNNEISIIDLISTLYIIYGLVDTFLGTTIIFFSLLIDTERLIKENIFLPFYDDFVLNERKVTIDKCDYELFDYKELIIKYIGKDNSTKFFRKLVEFFSKKKIEAEFLDDENFEEVILTNIREKYYIVDKLEFDNLLELVPEFWSPKANFLYLFESN